MIPPLRDSELTSNDALNLIPLPIKLFSVTKKLNEVPSVPTPAPAAISPVGFSVTSISIIFVSFVDPGKAYYKSNAGTWKDKKFEPLAKKGNVINIQVYKTKSIKFKFA